MKKLILLFISLFIITDTAFGQVPPPPAIITFTSDLATITVSAAEAGLTQASLAWQVVDLAPDQQLRLDVYSLNTWVTLPTPNETPLPAQGTLPVQVQHPLNFGPPTYRLSIINAQGQIVDERIIMIPYDTNTPPPAIQSFTTRAAQVDATALFQGNLQVPVAWELTNRPATANPVFEQVFTTGQTASVELPRPNRWAPSAGEGAVRLYYERGANQVILRLRLVDQASGKVYDQRDMMLSIVGSVVILPTSTPRPLPRPTLTPIPQMQVVYFTVTPTVTDRKGTVTVSWDVRGAASVSVWRTQPGGPLAEAAPFNSPTGAWTLQLSDYYVDRADFILFAKDAAGADLTANAFVTVRCPYTYFFGYQPSGVGCPLGPAIQTDAVFQAYERGFMLWRKDRLTIYMFRNGGTFQRFEDTWQPGEVVDTGEPPAGAGFVKPERGFGKIWVRQPGVRDDLGWALGPEQAFSLQVQTSGAYKYARTYFSWFDGRVIDTVENSWRWLGAP
jgi:hypothetical protein